MVASCSAAERLRSVPPRDRTVMLRLGLDLDNPEAAELCVEGVRAADDAIAGSRRVGSTSGVG
ncbi:hypothetical protein [Sorangium sp. So ce513]|uniref:hypothetical protein n=1 Tax=Sorangium sp. So ce513 TaxID=3133315 RepID=UPI003F614EBE